MKDLNTYIDHTLLKAEASDEDIKKLVDEAIQYNFYSVCVNSTNVSLVKSYNDQVRITSVVGFPLGAMATRAKAYEARCAIEDGADEIDMVINVGKVKSKDYAFVEEDIRALREETLGKTLKVIIETCLLTDEEKVEVCKIAKKCGADFVKTSTGFSTGGAKASDVRLMREVVGPDMGVKASGGIHSKKEAVEMIEAGATRLGTSASIAIIED